MASQQGGFIDLCVDLSFLMEIMDQRNALNLRGYSTRKLDEALQDEVTHVSSHLLPTLILDNGLPLLEYAPSQTLLEALADCDAKQRRKVR